MNIYEVVFRMVNDKVITIMKLGDYESEVMKELLNLIKTEKFIYYTDKKNKKKILNTKYIVNIEIYRGDKK